MTLSLLLHSLIELIFLRYRLNPSKFFNVEHFNTFISFL